MANIARLFARPLALLPVLALAGCGAAEGWQDTAELVADAMGADEQCPIGGRYAYELTDGGEQCPDEAGEIDLEATTGSCDFRTPRMGTRDGLGRLACDPADGVCEGRWTEGACAWRALLVPL